MLHNGLLNYNPLNMFRALLCPSSGARDYTGDYSMWHITLWSWSCGLVWGCGLCVRVEGCCSSNIPQLGRI